MNGKHYGLVASLMIAFLLSQCAVMRADGASRDMSNNDNFANAETITITGNSVTVNGTVQGYNYYVASQYGVALGPDPDDYYNFSTQSGFGYKVTLTYNVNMLQVWVLNSSASSLDTMWEASDDDVIGASTETASPSSVVFISPGDTYVYIVVTAFLTNLTSYNLTIEKIVPPPSDGNDDIETAQLVTGTSTTINSNVTAFDTSDYYKIQLDANAIDKLTITFNSTTDVETFYVNIYDPNEYLLSYVMGNGTNPVELSTVCGLTGFYYVEVYFDNAQEILPVEYTLVFTKAGITGVQAPEHDANNDFANATVLTTTLTAQPLDTTNDPHDFIKISLSGTVSSPEFMSLEVTTSILKVPSLNYYYAVIEGMVVIIDSNNLLVVTLHKADGTVVAIGYNTDQRFYINYTTNVTEDVYARFWLCNGLTTGTYTPSLSTQVIVPDNDNEPATATAITAGTSHDGSVNFDFGDDVDWYKIDLQSGETTADRFTVTLNLDDASKDASVRVRDPNGWSVQRVYTTGGVATIERTASTEGTYYISVSPYSYGTIDYTLSVNVTTVPFIDDHNNEYENATRIYSNTTYQTEYVSEDDLVDYYMYTAEAGDKLSFSLNALDCDYDLYLIRKLATGYPTFEILAESAWVGTNEHITNYTVTTAGDYYVVVHFYSTNQTNKVYRLIATVPTHNLPPTISAFTPSSTIVDMLPGAVQTFSVTASDTTALTYEWYVGGTLQAGENSETFNYVAGTAPTTVKCVVKDTTTGVSSVTWTVRIDPAPTLRASSPAGPTATIPIDGQQLFSVDAEDTNQTGYVTTASLVYNWSVLQSSTVVQYLGTSDSVLINHTSSPLAKGTYDLSVKITDTAGQAIYVNWTLTVPNHAPKFVGSTTTASCNEDANATIAGIKTQFVDQDAEDTVTVSVTGTSNVTAEFVGNDLKLTPKAEWYGVDNVTVTATDGTDSVSIFVRLTVANVNDAPKPKATLPTISFAEDSTYSIGIDQFFTDPEGSAVIISTVTADVGQVTVTKNGTNIDITPAPNYFGTFNLTIVATDGTLQSDLLRVPVTITGANDAPTVAITNPSDGFKTTAGKKITFDCTASDPDGDAITYKWFDGKKEMGTEQKVEKGLSAGKHQIMVTVSDGKLSTDSAIVNINVTENKSPGFEAAFLLCALACIGLLLATGARRRM